MQEEKQLSERESLELINRMIHEGKNYFRESGISALIGGFSVVVCSLLAYFMTKGLSFPFNPFYLLIIAFLLQVYFSLKEEKKKEAKTFTDAAIDYIWMGFCIAVLIVVVTGTIKELGYMIVSIVLLLMSFASFFTSMIAKYRFMIFASIVCWILTAASFLLLNENSYLLLAAASILVWVVLGFMMNAYLKKLQHGK